MEPQKLTRKYGLFTAICMVVGIVIGSGVFFKAQTILQKTNGDLAQGIWAWIIGGIIMIVCVLAFSVMATRYEKVNGVVDYAEATVGDRFAYAMGWFSTTIYYPAMTSVLAWLSARYTMTFLVSAFPSFVLTVPVDQGGTVVGPETMALTLFYLVAAYVVNTLSPKIAGYFQVSTTVIKLIPLGLMAVVGIIVGLTAEPHTLVMNFKQTSASGGSTLFGAVVSTAFAYEGWIIATSINAELKNAKRNLPLALLIGGGIIAAVYILYYIGVAGGADTQTLMKDGATVAFINVFGPVFGTILNLFVAISCMGTLNGLMLAATRGMYSIAVRGHGPRAKTFAQVDDTTNMPANSGIFALLVCAAWFLYFYIANLAPGNWLGVFAFDSSELPIITIYGMYIPILVMFMVRSKDLSAGRRFVLPSLAILGSAFMVCAALYAHGVQPFLAAAEKGQFSCPVLFYLIAFAVIMTVGMLFYHRTKATKLTSKH